MENFTGHIILDVNATELDRAANFETAKAVAQRHADRLGYSTFIRPPRASWHVQVRPSQARRTA